MILNSRPGSPNSLFLDFTGRLFGDDDVLAIWREVAEIFSPFDLNVTTAPQAGCHTVYVCSGQSGFTWVGWPGTSVMDGNSLFLGDASFTQPYPGWRTYCARMIAHEAGHAAGLLHQSKWAGGAKVEDADYGDCDNASSPCKLAPLMGNYFHVRRAVWTSGTNDMGAPQFDGGVLASRFGLAPKTVGQTWDTPTPLKVDGDALTGAGIIRNVSDIDVWGFTGSGHVSFTLTVPEGGLLVGKLELRDAHNNTVARGEWQGDILSVEANVPAGKYLVLVSSIGTSVGYVGSYSIAGTQKGKPPMPPKINPKKQTLSLDIENPDGRPLTTTRIMGNLNYVVCQLYGLFFGGSWDHDWLGGKEIWIKGTPNQFGQPWYYLLESGDLFAWDGDKTKLAGEKIATLDMRPDVWAHPGQIFTPSRNAETFALGVTVADGVFTRCGVIPVDVRGS